VTAHDDEHESFLPPTQPTSASRVTSGGMSLSMSDGLFGPSCTDHPPHSHGHGNGTVDAQDSDAQDIYVRDSVWRRVHDVREAIRVALQEALEERAEAGDVQTCAVMALVASEELRIGARRVQRFVEAYIGALDFVNHTTLRHPGWCQFQKERMC
jgi:hypothetical protein